MIISSSSKWTGRNTVELNIENERFTIVYWRCCKNLKFGNFTLSFGRLRQRIALKCVPHVQHDYFYSFNQSDHCFLASSLIKLPNNTSCSKQQILLTYRIRISRPSSPHRTLQWPRMCTIYKMKHEVSQQHGKRNIGPFHTKTIVNANASKRKLFYAFRPSVHKKTMKTLTVNA